MYKNLVAALWIFLSAPAWATECWSFKSFADDDRIFDEITEVQFEIDPQTSDIPERIARLRIFESVKRKNSPAISEGNVKCEKDAQNSTWHCVAVERGIFQFIRQGDEARLVIEKYLNTLQQSGKEELGFEFEVAPGDPPIEMVTKAKCPPAKK